MHYRTDHSFVDEMQRGEEQLLAIWFNPIRWSLPIDKSVIHLVFFDGLETGATDGWSSSSP